MKKFMQTMLKDYKDEGFNTDEWVMSAIISVVLIAVMGIAGWMDMLSRTL